MKRIVAATILFSTLVFLGWAQKSPATNTTYYDTFSQQWLDSSKWVPDWANHSGANLMESVREIQNGRLRMMIRNTGSRDSDYGFQYADNTLYFQNPNVIKSITADITLGRVNVVGCAANLGEPTHTITKIMGNFFNAGTGYPWDDIDDDLLFWVDPSNPRNIIVSNWFPYFGSNVYIGTYPIGTPLTATLMWDQANHRFVSVVMVKGDASSAKTVINPYYSLSDTTAPAMPNRFFTTVLYSANCTTAPTSAELEAFIDNVIINSAPPNDNQQ